MNAIREALDAASNAGVPVVWPDGVRYDKWDDGSYYWLIVENVSHNVDAAELMPWLYDLTVAAIKRGLVKADATLMTEGCSKGWHAHVMLENGIEVEGTGSTELAALTAALKGISLA